MTSGLFTWYVASFGSYDATYGSLGAIFGFMTWLWIAAIIVIVGAELNSEIEHQTERDTTTGRPRPMGERGAVMADTIGDAYGAPLPTPAISPSFAAPGASRYRSVASHCLAAFCGSGGGPAEASHPAESSTAVPTPFCRGRNVMPLPALWGQ